MTISKNTVALLVVALIVGFSAGYFMPGKSFSAMDGMTHGSLSETMNAMSGSLEGKKGEELERAFLDEMTTHHLGAIEMANQLKAGTTRPELLKMADDIILAQTQEVEQMRAWKADWFKK